MAVSRIAFAASLAASIGLMPLLGSCGKDEGVSSPCARNEFAGCGLTCGSAADVCQVGMHCGSDSTCTAQCTAASAADDCGRNQVCSSDGHCMADPNATLPDGGKRDGGSGSMSGNDAGSGNCGFITLQTAPITPNVILIIDQSSSMDEKFGSGTRWTALRDSLLSETGLIKELEHVVRFGATFYSAREKEMPCPMLTEVQVAIDNFENIKAKYPGRTIAETPTGDSIEAVLKKLPQAAVDDKTVPTIFILATDGEPDRCEELNPQKGQQEALDAVKHAFSMGIRTYIIGVGEEVSDAHMQEMANTGVGQASGNAPKWRANDDKGLRDALRTIVGGEVGCKVPLQGKVTGGECAGTIKINGKAVACSPTEGYQIADGSAVQLNGTACDAIKKGEVLSAMFECDEAIPLF